MTKHMATIQGPKLKGLSGDSAASGQAGGHVKGVFSSSWGDGPLLWHKSLPVAHRFPLGEGGGRGGSTAAGVSRGRHSFCLPYRGYTYVGHAIDTVFILWSKNISGYSGSYPPPSRPYFRPPLPIRGVLVDRSSWYNSTLYSHSGGGTSKYNFPATNGSKGRIFGRQ